MVAIASPRRAAPGPTSGPPDFRHAAERLKQVSYLTRLWVLLLLGDGERSVGSLGSETSSSMAALSRHLAFLRLAGLVEPRRDAQGKFYHLTDAGRALLRVVLGLVD